MLELCDRITLPGGVRLEAGALVDDVRGTRYPLNATAETVVAAGGAPLERVATQVAERWSVPHEDARRDVLRFAWTLNGHGLANISRGAGRIARARVGLMLALKLLPAGRVPGAMLDRRPLDTDSIAKAAISTVRAIGGRALVLGVAAAVCLFAVSLSVGGVSLLEPVAIGTAGAAALLVHELGHATALRGIPAALVLDRGRVSVIHAPVSASRGVVVALAGPAVPTVVGLVLSLLALRLGSPLLAFLACPTTGHALTATVACRDGRAACLPEVSPPPREVT